MHHTVGTISSWHDLAQLADECADERWVFRGESQASRPLRPKAGRVSQESNSPRKLQYDKSHEVAALELFKRQSRPYLNPAPTSDIEWLAVAQHHGMATRLLDWTESVLVAAYFASSAAGTSGEAVIYGAMALADTTLDDQARPFDAQGVSMYRPPHIAARIPAQRSVFTLHAEPTADFANEVTTWRIQGLACLRIKAILDACAINEASLFPDVDGLAKYIGWRYKWGKF